MAGFVTRQFFRNLPLLLVKNVPARLLPAVVPRFLLVYSLMVAVPVPTRPGAGRRSRGAAQSFGSSPLACHGDGLIQRSRRVDVSALRRAALARVCHRACECCAVADRLAAVGCSDHASVDSPSVPRAFITGITGQDGQSPRRVPARQGL